MSGEVPLTQWQVPLVDLRPFRFTSKQPQINQRYMPLCQRYLPPHSERKKIQDFDQNFGQNFAFLFSLKMSGEVPFTQWQVPLVDLRPFRCTICVPSAPSPHGEHEGAEGTQKVPLNGPISIKGTCHCVKGTSKMSGEVPLT